MTETTLHQAFADRISGCVLGAGSGTSADELLTQVNWGLPAGGRWDDAIGLRPCRELPLMLAEDLCLDPHSPRVAAFQAAHVTGVLHGLLIDRRADGQLQPGTSLVQLERPLRRRWAEELGQGLGDPERARSWVATAMTRLRSAMRAEGMAFQCGSLNLELYFHLAGEKLVWSLLPAFGLLVTERGAEAVKAGPALVALTLSLQCLDDAVDVLEDERTRGSSYPALLAVPPAALESVSKELASRGAEIAVKARLPSLASWCQERAQELSSRRLSRMGLKDRLLGVSLSLEAESALRRSIVEISS